ncbi:MAG: NEW3 domain-containing protein [Acidimicrobiia bacterium]
MKRVLLATALVAALFLSTAPVASATADSATAPSHPELLLVTPYPAVSTQPGTTIKLDLKAYAPRSEPVTLAVEGTPAGWTTILRGGGFVISGVTADPDTPATAQLEIQVAPDAEPGSYSMTVVSSDGSGSASLPITVDVAEVVDAGIGITADFPKLKGGPTDTFTYTLTVANNTPTSQTFNFAPRGPQGWTVSASPQAEERAATLTIDGGADAKVNVSASPPATVEEGSYPVDVTVTAANGATGTITLQAEVAGAGALALSTATGRLDASGHSNKISRETLIVANTGSGELSDVKLAATPPKGWEVTFEPATVAGLAPNDTAQVVAVIKPAKDAVAGDYSLTVRASAGSSSQTVDLRYRVTSSSWLGFLGVVVIVGALAILGLSFRRFGRR